MTTSDPREQSSTAPLVIRGDGAHRYTYAKVWVLVGSVISLLMIPLLVSSTDAIGWLIFFGAPLVMGLEAAACCWIWTKRQLRVAYVVEDGELRALRGDKIVKRLPTSAIRNIEFMDRMTIRSFFVRFQPDWPSLEIHHEERGRVVLDYFPEIMLWDEELDVADDALRQRLNLG